MTIAKLALPAAFAAAQAAAVSVSYDFTQAVLPDGETASGSFTLDPALLAATTAVPLPAPALLQLTGLAGLGLAARRRRRA